MDIESVLRELRVDWENAISHDFDPVPLIQAIQNEGSTEASNFRNMYHKVEQAMEKIIEANFKAFNDSILLYSKVHKANTENLRKLGSQIDFCNQVITTNLDVNFDTKEIRRSKHIKWLCEVLKVYKELYENIERALLNRNYVYGSSLVKKMFDIHRTYKLERIKCLKVLFQKLCDKRVILINFLSEMLGSFVYDSKELEYISSLDALVSINGLKSLDQYLYKNIDAFFVAEYSCIISSYFQVPDEDPLKVTIQNIMHVTNKMYTKLLSLAASGLNNSTEVIDASFFEAEVESSF